jgi:hypothetical protein
MPRIKLRIPKNNEQEERIQSALEKRAREGTSFAELELEYGVPGLPLMIDLEEPRPARSPMPVTRPFHLRLRMLFRSG